MSKIEIINRALLKLGEPPISSLNDAAFSTSYEMIFNDVKNLLLSAYPWRFAVKTQKLARLEKMFAGRFMYPLPADCLLLLKVYVETNADIADFRAVSAEDYEIADGCVLVFYKGAVQIDYVTKLDDDADFPPLFREALVCKIAAELSMRLKHSLQTKQIFDNEFFNFIRQAELNNEIMKSAEFLPDGSWIKIRHAWTE